MKLFQKIMEKPKLNFQGSLRETVKVQNGEGAPAKKIDKNILEHITFFKIFLTLFFQFLYTCLKLPSVYLVLLSNSY